MSASLVGSEMCIRDRRPTPRDRPRGAPPHHARPFGGSRRPWPSEESRCGRCSADCRRAPKSGRSAGCASPQ
eukprot:10003249-Alexandrium_andersonii.AAC.1